MLIIFQIFTIFSRPLVRLFTRPLSIHHSPFTIHFSLLTSHYFSLSTTLSTSSPPIFFSADVRINSGSIFQHFDEGFPVLVRIICMVGFSDLVGLGEEDDEGDMFTRKPGHKFKIILLWQVAGIDE